MQYPSTLQILDSHHHGNMFLLRHMLRVLSQLTLSPPLTPFDFGHMLSVDAIHFAGSFYASKKGGIGGGGWVSARGAIHMAAALSGCGMALVGTGWIISHLVSTNGCRDHCSPPVGHRFCYCRQF